MPKNYLSQAKVLIVDDEPSNVRLLERICRSPAARKSREPRIRAKPSGFFWITIPISSSWT